MRGLAAVSSAVVVLGACGGGDDDAAGFCEILQRSDQITFPAGASPDALRATVTSGRETFTQLAAVAPEEVRPAVEAVRHGFDEYAAAVESVGFDLAALEADAAALERSEAFYSEEVADAKAGLGAYARDECGITLGR